MKYIKMIGTLFYLDFYLDILDLSILGRSKSVQKRVAWSYPQGRHQGGD